MNKQKFMVQGTETIREVVEAEDAETAILNFKGLHPALHRDNTIAYPLHYPPGRLENFKRELHSLLAREGVRMSRGSFEVAGERIMLEHP